MQREEEEEEELEGFDAMQTGSTKARRQKFSIHHEKQERLCASTGAIRLQRSKASKFTLCNI